MLEADRAYEALRLMIVRHELRDGYPILDKEIAESLNMSRTPVREAIQRLKAEGLLETAPRKGVFVKQLSPHEIRESFEYGEAVEGMAAYLAAERADEAMVAELEQFAAEMDQALSDQNIMEWIASDERFHAKLWQACGNRIIEAELQRLYVQIHRVRVFITAGYINKSESNAEHQAMIDAIRAGKAEESRSIHQQHWHRIRMEVLRVMRIEGFSGLIGSSLGVPAGNSSNEAT